MPLSYNKKFSWMNIAPVIEDHILWFDDFVEGLFYPDSKKATKPSSFETWVNEANSDRSVAYEDIDRLSALHSELFELAAKIESMTMHVGQKPPAELFQNLKRGYEEFLKFLQRVEHGLIMEESGYDTFTGLRSSKNFKNDVLKEMDRLERQGRNFCIAMARIDRYEALQNTLSAEEVNSYVQLVAELIKLSVRSFDDAYYMQNGEFVLSLKQTGSSGGFSALDRLRKELEQKRITLFLDNKETLLTMSCCVGEPANGDDIDNLLKNLRGNLDDNKRETDAILEYYEMSPLQRFIKQDSNTSLE
ncbi:MAG: diguanylate cyclase [Alphaproteobacteria bacterium]|nr:diguanylate cyclase [Alphaproteobacteria bacterium]